MRERLHLRSQFANIGKVVSHFLKKVSRSAHMEKGKPDWVLVITKYQRVPAGRNGGSGSKHKALVCITHVAKFISFYYLVHWLPAMETFNWATTLFPPSLPKVMTRDSTYYKKYRGFFINFSFNWWCMISSAHTVNIFLLLCIKTSLWNNVFWETSFIISYVGVIWKYFLLWIFIGRHYNS